MVCIFLLIFLCYAVAAIHVHCLFQLLYVWDLTSKQGFCAHLNNNPKAESQSQGHKLRYRALDWTVHLSLTLWPQQHLPGPCVLILPSSVIVTHLTKASPGLYHPVLLYLNIKLSWVVLVSPSRCRSKDVVFEHTVVREPQDGIEVDAHFHRRGQCRWNWRKKIKVRSEVASTGESIHLNSKFCLQFNM